MSGRTIVSASPWVRGPAWDSFWILSALWLQPVAWWLSRDYADPEEGPLDLLYFGLTALFWIGHRVSSTYLAYCTEAYRPLLRTQPVRFLVLPLLVLSGRSLLRPASSWVQRVRAVVIVQHEHEPGSAVQAGPGSVNRFAGLFVFSKGAQA